MNRFRLVTKVLLVLPMVLAVCSCDDAHSKEDLYSEAAEELVEVIASEGYVVYDQTVESEWQEKDICIFIDDYSNEEAEVIFDTCIFPYMSSNNDVIRKLLNESEREPQIAIVILGGSDGEDSTHYYSNIESLFEKWENGTDSIYLESYR